MLRFWSMNQPQLEVNRLNPHNGSTTQYDRVGTSYTQYLSPSMTADWFVSAHFHISFVVPRSAPRIHTIPRQYHVWEEGRLVPLFWCCRRSKLVWRFLRYGTRRCAIVSVSRWYCNLARLQRRWDVMQCCEQRTHKFRISIIIWSFVGWIFV